MDFAAVFFWAGLACLFVSAWVLRDLEADRMAAKLAEHGLAASDEAATARRYEHAHVIQDRIAYRQSDDPRPPTPFGWNLAHAKRQGRVALAIWRDERCMASDPRYSVTLCAHPGDCADCVACINQAIHWIQEHSHLPHAA